MITIKINAYIHYFFLIGVFIILILSWKVAMIFSMIACIYFLVFAPLLSSQDLKLSIKAFNLINIIISGAFSVMSMCSLARGLGTFPGLTAIVIFYSLVLISTIAFMLISNKNSLTRDIKELALRLFFTLQVLGITYVSCS